MTDDSDSKAHDIVVGALGAATGAIATVVAAQTGLGIAAVTGLGVFAGSIPQIIQHGWSRRAQRRCELAQRGIEKAVLDSGSDPAKLPNTDATQETFVAMFYELMDAVDDAVAPSLGHIAMTYANEQKPPDFFFRAFGRVVRELDAVELRYLRDLLRNTLARPNSGSFLLRSVPGDAEGLAIQLETKSLERSPNVIARGTDNEGWTEILKLRRGVRLLTLLIQHGLALEDVAGPGVWGANPVVIVLSAENARRALSHIVLDDERAP